MLTPSGWYRYKCRCFYKKEDIHRKYFLTLLMERAQQQWNPSSNGHTLSYCFLNAVLQEEEPGLLKWAIWFQDCGEGRDTRRTWPSDGVGEEESVHKTKRSCQKDTGPMLRHSQWPKLGQFKEGNKRWYTVDIWTKHRVGAPTPAQSKTQV